jgi:hypothetical protein
MAAFPSAFSAAAKEVGKGRFALRLFTKVIVIFIVRHGGFSELKTRLERKSFAVF